MLPMLIPEVIGIEARKGKAGDNATRHGEYICRGNQVTSGRNALDGKLAPDVWCH